jgi:hypothetical protein
MIRSHSRDRTTGSFSSLATPSPPSLDLFEHHPEVQTLDRVGATDEEKQAVKKALRA